jgi:ferredoxin
MQVPLVILAGIVVYDGWCGPSAASMNLAGVLPWIHWRGLVILALLIAGNVFCMACPFMLPRTLARRWLPARWSWPRRLHNKWLALVLLALFLWAYEAFALWDRPWWTAWLIFTYFAAAFLVDGVFRNASFCKYVCPIGQFNSVQSLVSPLEVRVRDPNVCTSCQTKDCIRGRRNARGCELGLYVPRKAGNMDCTLCLDCIHACPHDNIGLHAVPLGSDLARDVPRSGVGRFTRRPDLAALVVLLVSGAFANAAGMIEPVVQLEERVQSLLELDSPLAVITVFFAGALVLFPLASIGTAAALTRRWAEPHASILAIAVRYAYALVPLGFGMWLAHYSFHFLPSCDVIIPVARRFLADVGVAGFADPASVYGCCRTVPEWLDQVELGFLGFGFLGSLYVLHQIALARTHRPAQAIRALTPWAVLIVLLFAAGVWIILQPMQMRGAL